MIILSFISWPSVFEFYIVGVFWFKREETGQWWQGHKCLYIQKLEKSIEKILSVLDWGEERKEGTQSSLVLCFYSILGFQTEMGSRKEEERNEKIIRGLMKLPPNRRCINCNSLVHTHSLSLSSLWILPGVLVIECLYYYRVLSMCAPTSGLLFAPLAVAYSKLFNFIVDKLSLVNYCNVGLGYKLVLTD